MRKDADLDEYGRHSQRMNELVKQIPGFMPFTSRTGSRSARPSGTTSRLKTGRIDRFVTARNSGYRVRRLAACLGAFGGKAFDQVNAMAIQERVASGFFCQPVGTTT